MKQIRKYLEHYSSHRQYHYRLPQNTSYDVAVVVPLRGESALFPNCLNSLELSAEKNKKHILIIAVINHRVDDQEPIKFANRQHLKELSHYSGSATLLLVDCANAGYEFPLKQGVGLARKVGCDLALELFADGRINHPYLFTTDGDAIVPEDYFALEDSNDVALVHHFSHSPSPDEEVNRATELYEKWLRYYVLGLRHAQSPYAYQTVGSLLIIQYRAYAMVRGFPRKEAGEDFYLLNKLAKVGTVSSRSKRVSLRSRISDRVPFGTGRGVAEILGMENFNDFTFYHPKTFEILKDWLEALALFSRTRNLVEAKSCLKTTIERHALIQCNFELFWDTLKLQELLETADKTRPKETTCLKHLHTEFDAFQTRKFIHLLRDSCLQNLAPYDALTQASFAKHTTDLCRLRLIEETHI